MNTQFKCLTPLAMFYMSIKLITVLLIYKIVAIGSTNTTAATIIIPLWFLTGDIIAEVYGYDISKKVIWSAIFCQFIFAFICALLIKLPSPPNWEYQAGYDHVLGNLPRVAFASFVAIVSGAFINAYTISKWKVLLRGRFFWLRSLGASIVGEAVFTVIAFSVEFFGLAPTKTVLELMAMSFCTKLIVSPILVIPSSIIAAIIKRIEGVEVFDYDLEFNPFKLKSRTIANDVLIATNKG